MQNLISKSNKLLFGEVGLLMTVIVVWGFSWPVMKLLLNHLPPLWLGVSRMSIGALVLFAYLIITKQLQKPTLKDLPILLTVSLLFFGAFTACINLGLQHVEAGRSAILAYSTPLWITPIAFFVLKEPLSLNKIIGLLLGLSGILLLFNPTSINWHNHNAILGNGLLIFASLLWATTIIHIRSYKWHLTPLQLAPWQMLLAAIFLTILASVLEPNPVIHWNMHASLQLFFLGVFATAFAFWGTMEVSKRLPAVTSSVSMLGVPLLGVISSIIILKEHIALTTAIAMALLLLGLVFIAIPQKNAN